MFRHLATNIGVNFIFYRRNRLVLVAIFVFAAIALMSLVPSLAYSTGERFQTILMVLSTASWFITVFVNILAVLTITYHFNNRCFKMVVTKPCPPATWLLADLASLFIVTVALNLLAFIIVLCMYLGWHIPFQWGTFYLLFEGVARTMTIAAIITFLVSVMHPFPAIVLFMLGQSSTFYGLHSTLASAALNASSVWSKWLCVAGKWVAHVCYIAVPEFSLFDREGTQVRSSLKMTLGDAGRLGLIMLYTVLIVVLFFLLTERVFRRKRLT